MNYYKSQFLKSVLGEGGAQALQKAAERSSELENALVPRTILAWLSVATRVGHKGSIPGLEDTHVEFSKSENGYSGQIAIGDEVYEFQEQSLYHLAASVAVSMGVDHERVPEAVSPVDLQRLGKSIDLLVKARVIAEELKKRVLDPGAGYSFSHVHGTTGGKPSTTVNVHAPNGEHAGYATFHHQGDSLVPFGVAVEDEHQRKGIASAMYAHAEKVTGKKLVPSQAQTSEGAALWRGNAQNKQFGKAEGPGQAAAPTGAAGPLAPDAPTRQQAAPPKPAQQKPKLPRPPKTVSLPKLKLSEAQLKKTCSACAHGHLNQAGKFVGCVCWRALAKNTKLEKNYDGSYTMSFGAHWDRDAVEAFLSDMRVRK